MTILSLYPAATKFIMKNHWHAFLQGFSWDLYSMKLKSETPGIELENKSHCFKPYLLFTMPYSNTHYYALFPMLLMHYSNEALGIESKIIWQCNAVSGNVQISPLNIPSASSILERDGVKRKSTLACDLWKYFCRTWSASISALLSAVQSALETKPFSKNLPSVRGASSRANIYSNYCKNCMHTNVLVQWFQYVVLNHTAFFIQRGIVTC